MTSTSTTVFDPDVEDVRVSSLGHAGRPDRAVVKISDRPARVELFGDIAELRAVVVEIDRQLAILEVEARVDAAVADGQADDVDGGVS